MRLQQKRKTAPGRSRMCWSPGFGVVDWQRKSYVIMSRSRGMTAGDEGWGVDYVWRDRAERMRVVFLFARVKGSKREDAGRKGSFVSKSNVKFEI